MPIAEVSSGVSLAHECFGNPGNPPVLLVAGFGSQLIVWHEDFCRALADRGRYVIRFDNRDTGLSTRFDDRPVDMGRFVAAVRGGDLPGAGAMVPYRLTDMAEDAFGLLTALGIERAHVVGSSMGGMIAQTMAMIRPERLLTLTSMMSTTGESEYGGASPEARCCSARDRRTARGSWRRRSASWCGRRSGTAMPRRCGTWRAGAMTGRTTRPASAGTSGR